MADESATSLPKRVQEIFRSDGVIHETIRRGIVNYRALSRWMINAFDLDATEDAVLSAIRRLRGVGNTDPFRSARVVLAQCHLNVRSRTCQLIVPKSDEVRRKLPQIFQLVDIEKGELLYFSWGEVGLKIIIDESNLDAVQALFGVQGKRVIRRLAAVTVVEPEAGLNTPGILALMSETLALRGINVVDAVYGFPDYTFFVKEGDTLDAYQAIEALLAASGARATGGDMDKAGKKKPELRT